VVDVEKVIKSYDALQKWVENGEMARTLGTIADVAVKAAMESLESARFADDPKAETGRAITHLQTAHAALETKWEGGTYSDYSTYLNAATNDRKVLILTALAYQYVGDRAQALRVVKQLESFDRRFMTKYMATIVRHPVHTAKRSASFYVRPFKATKALWDGGKGMVRADGDIKQLREGIEQMELPAAV
jgi:hypothetical protein